MISVDGPVAIRALGLEYLAGADAGSRLVTWAHACDLPDPWVWFKAGDLVMTTGGGLPHGSAGTPAAALIQVPVSPRLCSFQ